MSVSSRDKRRALLLVLPVALYLLGSGWVMLTAGQVRAAGGCSLGGPWSLLPSAEIVQALYSTSWVEALTLRRLSSACIANLHIQIVASYIFSFGVTALIAAMISAILIPTSPHIPRHSLKDLAKSAMLFLGVGPVLLFIVYAYGNLMSFVAFDGSPSKTQLRFDGAYVSIFWYWWRATCVSVLGLVGIVMIVTGSVFLIYVAQLVQRSPSRP
jgi:hypothetical protein